MCIMKAVKGKTMSYFQTKRGAVGWPNPQAKRIVAAAEAMGLSPDTHEAQTGTIYITVDVGGEEDCDEVKIRVADHAECYCSESISCDPNGYDVQQTIEWLAKRAGVPVPQRILGAWKAAETRKVNAAAKRAARIEDRKAKAVSLLAGDEDISIDAEGWPEPDVPAGTPNRKIRIAEARKRISDAYAILNRE